MKLEGLTDNEKDKRIEELEAKLDSLQAQYEDMKQERDMFAEKLAETVERCAKIAEAYGNKELGVMLPLKIADKIRDAVWQK